MSRRRAPRPSAATSPPDGLRAPCPCGSGRRYRACHGRDATPAPFVARPFAGLVDETDWVAVRELLPCATALLSPVAGGGPLVLATVLPLARAAMVRADGVALVAAQVGGAAADPGADVAAAVVAVLEAAAAGHRGGVDVPRRPDGPALRELVFPEPLDVQVQGDFGFWTVEGEVAPPEVAASRERADVLAVPTARLRGVRSAYWCRVRERSYLRWVLPEPEEPLLDALARLGAGRRLALGPGTRFVGTFRAHGLLVPVWDLPPQTGPEQLEGPAAALRSALDEELAAPRPLRDAERRTRAGLLTRQLTLR